MKPRNLGHVRHRQKLWLKKLMATPLQHLPLTEGEVYCGRFFSHNDMGDSGKCPHCGAKVRDVVHFFGGWQHWETVPAEEKE